MSGANGRQLMVFSSMYGRLATSLLTLRSLLKIILSIAHAIKAARLGLAFNSTSLETAARARLEQPVGSLSFVIVHTLGPSVKTQLPPSSGPLAFPLAFPWTPWNPPS